MIRRCRTDEHARLTLIAFTAKNHWNYPEHYLRIWQDELTITADYLEEHESYCWDVSGTAVGFYSLTELETPLHAGPMVLDAGLWLEHIFVLPSYFGRGIGTALFRHCISGKTFRRYATLSLLADPHAAGFYSRMGCQYGGDMPSTIPGRTTPLYRYPAGATS